MSLLLLLMFVDFVSCVVSHVCKTLESVMYCLTCDKLLVHSFVCFQFCWQMHCCREGIVCSCPVIVLLSNM
jgi:hypothetical protein